MEIRSPQSAIRHLSITWLGHGTFHLTSPRGARILIDPWLAGNPACPAERKRIDRLDLILITHGHADHVDDAVTVGRATLAPIVAPYELSCWLEQKGLQNLCAMNIGGTERLAGIAVTMVPAVHSSGCVQDGAPVYLGPAVGYVLRFEDGLTVYFAGDTAVFGDMRLIKEMHAPSIAFLPIGGRYTMDPDGAARACALLGVRQVVPMHYGTFPSLTGTPARLRELVAPLGIEVLELKPGETAE